MDRPAKSPYRTGRHEAATVWLLAALLAAVFPAAAQERRVRVATRPADATVRFLGPTSPPGGVKARELLLRSPLGQVDVAVERPGYLPVRRKLLLIRGQGEVAPGVWEFTVELVPDGVYQHALHQFKARPLSSAAAVLALLGLLGAGLAWWRRRLRQILREKQTLAGRLQEADPDLTGHCVDGYRVVRPLGEGSFAQVYLVLHEGSGQPGALKILKAQCLDAEMIGRMEREVQVGLRLEHPSVARLLAAGSHRGLPYLITEYVPGGTLEARLSQGLVDLPQALRWFHRIAQGLAHAHRCSIVHRDLKPSNILLSPEGPKVVDFGAAFVADRMKLTGTGQTLGTPLFMAPEQLRGESDHRCDIYALGVLLFRLATGEYPFQGADVEQIVTAHLCQPVPSARARNPQVPELLDCVIGRMLAKRVTQRYQRLEDVLEDLEPLGIPTGGKTDPAYRA